MGPPTFGQEVGGPSSATATASAPAVMSDALEEQMERQMDWFEAHMEEVGYDPLVWLSKCRARLDRKQKTNREEEEEERDLAIHPMPRNVLTSQQSSLMFDEEDWKVYYTEHDAIVSGVDYLSYFPDDTQWCEDYQRSVEAEMDALIIKETEQVETRTPGTIDVEKLVGIVQPAVTNWGAQVHEDPVKFAVQLTNLKPPLLLDLADNGEMLLQQVVFSPIAALFYSFGSSRYCADQWVKCNETIAKKSDGEPCVASCKPDGAIRLAGIYCVAAMMELKSSTNNANPFKDEYKCILMTAMSLLAIYKARTVKGKGMTGEFAIPFVIGKGCNATLFVTRIKKEGFFNRPVVQKLREINMAADTVRERSEFIALLAVLVSKVLIASKDCLDVIQSRGLQLVGKYSSAIPKERTEASERTTSSKRSRSGTSASRPDNSARGQSKPSGSESESLALQVASQDGKVQHLSLLRPYLDVSNRDGSKHPQESPFYFVGLSAADPVGLVFCKVWREGDDRTDRTRICKEIELLRTANEHGVPSAVVVDALTSMDLPLSTKGSGTEYGDLPSYEKEGGGHVKGSTMNERYHVLVTNKLREDRMEIDDFPAFAFSLVRAVLKLHSIGILHCDIKPGNVLWNDQEKVVKLVDFGHAQYEKNAKHYRATRGYMAPEVVSGGIHSRMSEAFSVGKTIEAFHRLSVDFRSFAAVFHPIATRILVEVVQPLMAELAPDRISLREAETRLNAYVSRSLMREDTGIAQEGALAMPEPAASRPPLCASAGVLQEVAM